MDFTAQDHLRSPVAAVLEAYADPTMTAELGALAPLGPGEVLEHRRTGDQIHLRVRYAYRGDLPPGATAVVDPARLTWVQVTRLDLGARRARIELEPDNYADRLRAAADQRFEPGEAGGCVRRVDGRLSVKLFMAGRAVEGALVSGLQEYLANEAAAVDAWIDARRPPR